MTARRKNAAPQAGPSESTIYLDRTIAGTVIVERKGRIAAVGADGRRIGVFETEKLAMTAILAAARNAREVAR